MGGSSPSPPEPTPEERALQAQQTQLLRQQTGLLEQQARQNQALQPVLFEELGITPEFGDTSSPEFQQLQQRRDQLAQRVGEIQEFDSPDEIRTRQELRDIEQRISGFGNEIVGFEREADPLAQQREDIQGLQLDLLQGQLEQFQDPRRQELQEQGLDIQQQLQERTQQALAGDLPVSPALERNLGEQQQQLREQLREQLGPGFETSTPGIEALAEQEQRAEEIREGARRGQISLGEQLALGRSQGRTGVQSQTLSDLLGGQTQLGQQGLAGTQQLFGGAGDLAGLNLGVAQGFGQTAQGFSDPLSRMQRMRELEFEADLQGGGIGSVLGSLGGLAAGSLFGGAGGAIGRSLGSQVFGGGGGGDPTPRARRTG